MRITQPIQAGSRLDGENRLRLDVENLQIHADRGQSPVFIYAKVTCSMVHDIWMNPIAAQTILLVTSLDRRVDLILKESGLCLNCIKLVSLC